MKNMELWSKEYLDMLSMDGIFKEEAAALIQQENLNEKNAMWYIQESLKRGYASDIGNYLHEILPKMSPLNPHYLTKKQNVFRKITDLIEKFKE